MPPLRGPRLVAAERGATLRGVALVLALAAAAHGATAAAQFDPPDPEAYARAEDRTRAHLLATPCAAADEGRGCYRFDGRLRRELPCRTLADAHTMRSLPTDQCYRMEPPRRYRGVWIDQFEGQGFLPDGVVPPPWPSGEPGTPGWREQARRSRAAAIWLNVERAGLRHVWRPEGRRVLIEFVGRRTAFPGNHGHFGMFAHELIVDRVISLRECPAESVCR